jgi:HPr kinase/phosphorylase
VHLEFPAEGGYEERERLSTRSGTKRVLGVEIPTVTLTVAPGRNLAVLVEAAVRNYILITRGIDSTRDFISRQAAAMRSGGEADPEPRD